MGQWYQQENSHQQSCCCSGTSAEILNAASALPPDYCRQGILNIVQENTTAYGKKKQHLLNQVILSKSRIAKGLLFHSAAANAWITPPLVLCANESNMDELFYYCISPDPYCPILVHSWTFWPIRLLSHSYIQCHIQYCMHPEGKLITTNKGLHRIFPFMRQKCDTQPKQ